jgi:hypothetical protein
VGEMSECASRRIACCGSVFRADCLTVIVYRTLRSHATCSNAANWLCDVRTDMRYFGTRYHCEGCVELFYIHSLAGIALGGSDRSPAQADCPVKMRHACASAHSRPYPYPHTRTRTRTHTCAHTRTFRLPSRTFCASLPAACHAGVVLGRCAVQHCKAIAHWCGDFSWAVDVPAGTSSPPIGPRHDRCPRTDASSATTSRSSCKPTGSTMHM